MRLLLLFFLTFNLLHAKNIALLMGNDDYSFSPLSNPLNDVDGIYKTLKEIGFDISKDDVLKNVSQNTMQKALANFSQRAKDAEVALIYFSGHGMQVNNTNYMLPARTNPKKPVDLYGLVDLNYFIQSATSAKYGIVLVDACRDNPLIKYFQNRKYKGTLAKKGLGQVSPTVGQVIVGFATSAGDTANDGKGNMSPYAKALSVRLKEPNKDITKVLGLVALDVSAKYDQNPIIRTNFAYDVWLNRIHKIDEVKPTMSLSSKYALTINPTPSDAKVYITNIKSKYRDGIQLKKGKYEVKVKLAGYQTKFETINLTKRVIKDIVLEKENINMPNVPSSKLKWGTPKNSICLKKGGKIGYYGKCKASWNNAKKICSVSGGRLPTIDELIGMVINCGGQYNKNNDFISANFSNKSYQSCYKAKGFTSAYSWSSSINEDNSGIWSMSISGGSIHDVNKYSNRYVRCIENN